MMIGLLLIALVIGIVALIFMICEAPRKFVVNKAKNFYKVFKFNGLVRLITFNFLKYSTTLTAQLIYYRSNKWINLLNQSMKDQVKLYAQWIISLAVLISIPICFVIKLKNSRSQFNDEKFIQVYGVLIENLKHRKIGIVFYSAIILSNRLIFAFIPFAF